MKQKKCKILRTVINASAAVTLLEQRPEKIQALSGIRTHDLCGASAVHESKGESDGSFQ